MKKEDDIQNKIDLYLKNKLSAEEKTDFEKEIDANPLLAKEVELTRHLVKAFEKQAEKKFIEQLADIDEKEFQQKIKLLEESIQTNNKNKTIYTTNTNEFSGRHSVNKKPSCMPVFLLGLIIIGAIFLLGRQYKYSTTELFHEFYRTPSYSYTLSEYDKYSLTPEEEKELAAAIHLYEIRDFKNSLAFFNKLTSEKEFAVLPEPIIYYQTINLIETEELDKALTSLNYIAGSENTQFQESGLWLQALVYIKMGERKESQKILSTIEKRGEIYTLQAKELLYKSKKRRWFFNL